jgi:hypothetical protein
MNYELTVAGFSDDQIILQDDDKNIIYWPKNKLPKIPEIGQKINFSVGNAKADILNELLRTDN